MSEQALRIWLHVAVQILLLQRDLRADSRHQIGPSGADCDDLVVVAGAPETTTQRG